VTATKTTAPNPTARDTAAEIAYLTRALKAPILRDAVARLGGRARAGGWTHEQFLAACLQREVAARESHGGEDRIRATRFPARKTLEEFDFDHQRSLKRDLIAHLGTLDFVAGKTTSPISTRSMLKSRGGFCGSVALTRRAGL
jgi:DNA replication protein DnaC